MHTVLGMSELLAQTTLTPPQRQYVDALRQAATSLATLLDGILDLSQASPGPQPLRQERFWLPDLAGRVVDVVAHLAASKHLSLTMSTSASVPRSLVGDPVRLQQVLVNLMVNAIKYTATGAVSFDVDGAATGPDADLVFTVKDTGPGIAADQVQRLFESRLLEHGHLDGMGLGLAVSRRLVGAMGGTIDVESHTATAGGPPCGSTFRVRLKLPIARTLVGPLLPTVAVRALRFLVIGSADLDDAVTGALAAWAPRVEHAADEVFGERLFHTALGKNDPFHVVVLDAALPYAGAVAFGAALRGRATVLVALPLAGLADVGNLVEEIGAWPLLVPVTTATLYAALERALDPLARLAPLPPDLPDLGGRVVHVADEHADGRALVQAFLDGTGLEVVVHKDAHALLQAVADDVDRAGLVIVDADVEGAGGAGFVLDSLRHDPRTRGLPVIALSAADDDAAFAAVVDRGFHDVLQKPFTRQSLVNCVHRHAQTQAAPLPAPTPSEVQLAARMALARRDHGAIVELARRLPKDLGKRLEAAARKKDDAALRAVLRDLDAQPAVAVGAIDDAARAQLPDYLQRRAQDARDIADAVSAGRYDVVAFIGQRMAGTGVAFGLPQLSEIGAQLEVAGCKREGSLVLRELRRLQDLLAAVDGAGR